MKKISAARNNKSILDVEMIDLEPIIKKFYVKDIEKILVTLSIFSESLKEDILILKTAQMRDDIFGVREILHKIQGALRYSGTPGLEKAILDLHAAVKSIDSLKEITEKFNVVYEQVDIFEEYYQTLKKNH